MKKFLSRYAFWILQFLGWGALTGFSLWATNMIYQIKGIGVIFLPMVLAGVISTSILRWVFKRYVSLQNFGFWDLFKIIVSIVVASFLFGKMIYAFGYITGYIYGYLNIDRPILTESPPDPGNGKNFGYFIIFTGWVILYFGIKLLIMLNDQRIEKINLKASIRQAQLNTLKGQVNPQFMFTSLTNIKGLMLEDVGKSRDMLTKLSEILRYALTKNNVNAIVLEEELEMVDNYVALSNIQLEGRIKFIKKIEPHMLTFSIPPMLVLQLVENSIKHGVFNTKKEREVVLTIFKEESDLNITVTNFGKRVNNKESELAQKKIKQRLRLLFDEKATYNMIDEDDKTSISIIIPLP